MRGLEMREWRPVTGFHGFYEVSDAGEVRSLPRSVKTASGHYQSYPGKTLKTPMNNRGYPTVQLYRDSRRYHRLVHRLVAEAFLGPQPDGCEVMHLDADRSNPRVENLRWGTRSENGLQRTVDGNNNYANRTQCPRGHELAAPNLVPSTLIEGRRRCRACTRAKGSREHAESKGLTIDFDKSADEHYARILRGETAYNSGRFR